MAQKSSETETKIDAITNLLNIFLIILGITLISLGIYYLLNNQYPYLSQTGAMIVIGGSVAILVGLWGFFKHAKIVKKMKAQAKENLNY